ncbi:MAG: hypothetical protein P9L94_04180 [Candidatus Hinthialibacter antarcticus]|nr:hypothetical protein [Candidatus Hinthialibacter antarcticus]
MNETLVEPLKIDNQLPPVAPPQEAAAPVSPPPQTVEKKDERSYISIALWCLKWIWIALIGTLFCQMAIFALFVVGWAQRYMQRCVIRRWFHIKKGKFSPREWEAFVVQDAGLAYLNKAPNWFWRQKGTAWPQSEPGFKGFIKLLGPRVGFPLHSFGKNFKLGFQAIVNIWIFTLPACILWLYAWHAGWNNSFHKVYEQAFVGPVTGILGILLFIAAMFYVPMAHTRQAATGQWRSFFEFGLVWRIIRERWLSAIGLAILFSLFSLPLSIMKMAPVFMMQGDSNLATMSDMELLGFLRGYYLFVGLLGFIAYVLLRVVTARIYAKGVLRCVEKGTIKIEQLSSVERRVMSCLDVKPEPAKEPRHVVVRAGAWTGRRVMGVTGFAVLVVIWFSFVAQIFVSEFFNYHPFRAWMNQPLVQLPWYQAIPKHLLDAEKAHNAALAETAMVEEDSDDGVE